MLCSKCRRQAVIYQRYSGLSLCRTHFEADFEAKAKRAIRVHRWLSSGDRIGVVMNGGKNSGALLYFLKRLVGRRRDVELLAVTIDEGIQGYSDTVVAQSMAQEMGVRLVSTSFREVFGMTFDEIASRRGFRPSCPSCCMLRSLCLERTALDHGLTRFALGMTLDDEALGVFSSVITGEAERIVRLQESIGDRAECIRPFMYIPEGEVELYASCHVETWISGTCPYASDDLCADIRSLLYTYTTNHPAAHYALVNLGDRLRELAGTGKPHDRDPGVCAGWSALVKGSCRSCRIPDEVGDA
jgi:tRNA(Ile)-lysidine synthase TilS/MesJ